MAPLTAAPANLIDGKTAAIVHMHAPTARRRRIVYTHTCWPTNGVAHTIKVIVLGPRGHPLADIDAVLTIR